MFNEEKFSNEFDELLKTSNYNGLADLLSKQRLKDANAQSRLNQSIAYYRQKARGYLGLMSMATPQQKQAIVFANHVNNGYTIPDNFKDESTGVVMTNPYAKKYNQLVRNIGNGTDVQNNPQNIATSLKVKFEGNTVKRYGLFGLDFLAKDETFKDTGFDLFKKKLNISDDPTTAAKQLGQLGVSVAHDEYGGTTIQFKKNNPALNKIIQGLSVVDTNHTTKDIHNKIDENYKASSRYMIAGVNAKGDLIKNASYGGADNIFNTDDEHFFSTTQRREGVDYHYVNPSFSATSNPIMEMNDLITHANKIAEEPIANSKKPVSSSSLVMPYNGNARAQLEQMLSSGQIDEKTYNTSVKSLDESYNNIIAGTSFANMKIYGNPAEFDKDGDNNTLREYNSQENSAAEENIKSALNDGDRLKYQAAVIGDKIGTMITVLPKANEKGEIEDNNHERQYFVQDLFKGEAESAFNSDTKTRAAVELNQMQTYNYANKVPGVGTIENVDNDGADLIKTVNGKVESTRIGKDEAIRHLNKMLILQDGVLNANQSFYDEDGNYKDNPDLPNQIENYAKSAASELYPKSLNQFRNRLANKEDTTGDEMYFTNKINEIKNYILGEIGYHG